MARFGLLSRDGISIHASSGVIVLILLLIVETHQTDKQRGQLIHLGGPQDNVALSNESDTEGRTGSALNLIT
jgi:hypothetical protein